MKLEYLVRVDQPWVPTAPASPIPTTPPAHARAPPATSERGCGSPTSEIPIPNPNGIPSSSPGLRGTSYPGNTIPKPTTPTGLRPGNPEAAAPAHYPVPQASSPASSAASRRPNLRTGRGRPVIRSRGRLPYRVSARKRWAHLSFLRRSVRVCAVRQGRPKIAQHFSAGRAVGEPESPVRDDRGMGTTFLSSLPGLSSPPPPTQH